jgi:hypothetical protein
MQRLLRSRVVQAKLNVGQPDDAYEREADRVADTVMRMPAPATDNKNKNDDQKKTVQRKTESPKKEDEKKTVQRKSDEKKKDEPKRAVQRAVDEKKKDDKKKPVQRKADDKKKNEQNVKPVQRETEEKNDEDQKTIHSKAESSRTPDVTPQIESAIETSRSSGHYLSDSSRSFYEPRFGRDLSQVRLHTDSTAANLARDLNAQAFTQGQDIYFGAGRYQPHTSEGQRLLGHELTHTIQQGGTSSGMGMLSASAVETGNAPWPVIQRSNGRRPDPRQTEMFGTPPTAAPGAAPSTTDTPGADPTNAAHFPESQGRLVSRNTILFDKLEIPRFKVSDHRAEKYAQQYGTYGKLARKAAYLRGEPGQRERWQREVDKARIRSDLQTKIYRQRRPDPNQALPELPPSQRYVLTVATSNRPLSFFGTLDELCATLTTPLWGGESTTPMYKEMQVDHTVELQIANWNSSTAGNRLPNMELLERRINESCGEAIAGNIIQKVKDFNEATANRYASSQPAGAATSTATSSPTPDTGTGGATRRRPRRRRSGAVVPNAADTFILQNYTLEFREAEPVNTPQFNVTRNDYWTQEDIEAARHMGPVRVSSFADFDRQGRVFIFNYRAGGATWGNFAPVSGAPDSTDRYRLAPFRVRQKSFNVDPGVDIQTEEGFGVLTIDLAGTPPLSLSTQLPIDRLYFNVRRIVGSRYAGFLDRAQILASLNRSVTAFGFGIPGASPITIDEIDFRDTGFYMRGRIVPDVPLLRGTSIDYELLDGDLRAFKTFSPSDISLPPPFRLDNISLTLAAGTRSGLSATGRVDFGIERLGRGYLEARASTGMPGGREGGFALEGGFDFDSNTFNPARVRLLYENGEFSGTGELGIPAGKVRGIRSATITASYARERLEAHGTAEFTIPGIRQGTLDLIYSEAEGMTLAGALELGNVPGIRSGSLSAQVRKPADSDQWLLSARGTAVPDIPGIDSTLTVSYDNGLFTAEARAAYNRGMLAGTIEVGATNRPLDAQGQPIPGGEPTADLTLYGSGQLTIRITPWLQGTAAVRLLPNGEIEVTGSIGLPSSLDVVPDEKRLDRNIFSIGLDIPILGVAAAGQRIGIFATIRGGLDASAGIGPVQLRELGLTITYNPAHEEQTHVTGSAQLHIPAHAGLRLFVSGGLGAGIPIVSASLNLEVGASLGLEGAVQAGVEVDWTPTRGLVLDAVGEIYVQPKFRFDITGRVLVELDLVLTEIELYSHRWNLASFEYGSDLRFGIRFPVHYEEGRPFDISLSDVEFDVPQIDPLETLSGLIDRIL